MSLRSLWSRTVRERERDEEMQAHVALYAEQLEAQGRTPDEAQREARLTFGNPRAMRERVDALNGVAWLDALGRDMRYALRSLRRSPGFTSVVLAVFALGMGASIAVFAIVDTMVLRPLPFEDPGRLIAIMTTTPAGEESSFFAPQDASDLRARQDVFEALASVRPRGGTYTLGPDDLEERGLIVAATADLFQVLRVAPQVGRLFTADNELAGRDDVVLISDRFWRRRFNADPGAVGKTITFGTTARRVIGVMPRGFEYPVGRPDDQKGDFWIPYVLSAQQKVRGNSRAAGDLLVGRLRPHVTMAQADARMTQIGHALALAYPSWFAFGGTFAPHVVPLRSGYVGSAIRPWLYLLLGAVVCVALLTAVNVANLVLARASMRGHEFRIRVSLGAAHWQIVRAMTVETLILSLIGIALACGCAWWAVGVLRAAMPAYLPFVGSIGLDGRIVGIAVVVGVLLGVLLGVLPALQSARGSTAIHDARRSHTADRRTHRIRGALVIVEVALALMLTVGSGLFAMSFMKVVNVDLGIDYRHVSILTFTPKTARGSTVEGRMAAHASVLWEVMDRVSRVPGVEAVAAGTIPLTAGASSYSLKVEGQSHEYQGDEMILNHFVSPAYSDVLKLRLLRGRWLTEDDVRSDAPVVVMSDAAVRKYLAGADPLTARVALGDATMRRVVGVVDNVRNAGPEVDVR
jgi:predicted permease